MLWVKSMSFFFFRIRAILRSIEVMSVCRTLYAQCSTTQMCGQIKKKKKFKRVKFRNSWSLFKFILETQNLGEAAIKQILN